MDYRLGLDVGTASLGLAAVSLDGAGEPKDIVWHSVRIFSEPTEKGPTGRTPKKAARRAARLQRRQISRRARRLRRIAYLAELLGLDRKAIASDDGQSLPRLRAEAATQRVQLEDLLRIFLRLAKRRGYAGEFKIKTKDSDTRVVETGSSQLGEEMQSLARKLSRASVTLGEYLHHRTKQGLPTRLKNDRDDLPNLYALRSTVEAEFEQIWNTQAQFHLTLNGMHDGRPLKDIFREAIFFQRHLKSPAPMVGNCSLEPSLPRASRAQMAAQAFRIEKQLADLRWGTGRLAQPLSSEQKAVMRELLNSKEKVSFKAIYKALHKGSCPGSAENLNLERLSRDELRGNSTLHAFRKLRIEDRWMALDDGTQTQVINLLASLGSPEQLNDPDWPNRFWGARKKKPGQRKFSQPMVDFVNAVVASGKFDRLSKMGFEGGRSAYSVKALKRLTDWFRGPHWPGDWQEPLRIDEQAAIRVCYQELEASKPQLQQELPPPKRTGNDVVDGALRQIRVEVNKAIRALGGPPKEIIVELARDMKAGLTKRNEWEKQNLKNQRLRREAKKEIEAAGQIATGTKIRKYLLWSEQGQMHCPYCADPINLEMALGGNATNEEHILPRTLTQVGRKRSEIVLAHKTCNDEKGDHTPFQTWGHDPERWQIIEARAEYFKKYGLYRKAKLLLLKDFEREVLSDESIADFADRQLHETSWIAKATAQWMRSICANPFAGRGELTAYLRQHWKLNTVIPEIRIQDGLPVLDTDGGVISAEEFEGFRKQWDGHRLQPNEPRTDRALDKRIDHRHHLIDAIVVALSSRSLFQQMAHNYKRISETSRTGESAKFSLTPEPPIRDLREQALRLVRECKVSHKPDRYSDGGMFLEMPYGTTAPDEQGRCRLTKRTLLKNLVDNGGDVGKTMNNLQSITSGEVRAIVVDEFQKRIVAGDNATSALAKPILYPRYGTLIRAVNVQYKDYADKRGIVVHQSRDGKEHTKRYKQAGYAYLESEIENGTIARQGLVPIRNAMLVKDNRAPATLVRLYKGDTVLDSKDGKRYRIGYFKAEGNIHLIPIVDPRSFDEIKEPGSGKKKVSFNQVLRLKRL